MYAPTAKGTAEDLRRAQPQMTAMSPLDTKLPATALPPEPSAPGVVVHSLYDMAAYGGGPAYWRYAKAETDEERMAALADMPLASVTFYEIPEGQPLFDTGCED